MKAFKIVLALFLLCLSIFGFTQLYTTGEINNAAAGAACLIISLLLFRSVFRSRKKEQIINSPESPQSIKKIDYSSESTSNLLENGKTIAEQQKEDYKIAQGIFPEGTHTFYDMKIVSSTIPPMKNYALLNHEEKTFFSNFKKLLIESNYKPELVKLTRLSDGTFNVDYIGLGYVGKVRLYKQPTIYAVIKKGNKRASKIFNEIEAAQEFASTSSEYEIQERKPQSEFYMQYLVGLTTVKELHNPSLQQCIDTLPRWIKYLNYCKRN